MAAINRELAEARRALSDDRGQAEIDRLAQQLKKLEAEFLG
jgi:5-formyltetrahydrofolate cyclo-ligase